MAGLFGALGQSVQALNAQSQGLTTAGKNLANVNNANYARQRVILGDRGTVQTPLGAQSLGLEALSIQSIRDPLLDQQVVRENAILANYTSQQNAYQQAQVNLGQSIDQSGSSSGANSSVTGGGIQQSLNDLFNSFSSFAAQPTDTGERETLIQNANILTDNMHAADSRLSQLQTDLTTKTTSDVTDANTILSSIADLNAQIARYEIGNPGSAVDLRDERQAQLEQLAQKINVSTVTDPSNASQIIVYANDSSGNQINLVKGSSVTGPLTLSGSTVSGGSPSTALVLTGGSIDGNLTARDGEVQSIRDDLNALAKQLVTSVNGAYDPTSPSTGKFFNPANVTAATISLDSSVTATTLKASNTSAAGDNTIAQAVANLATKTFATSSSDFINGTFSSAYATTVSNLGQTLSTTNQNVQDQTNVTTLVTTQRNGVSGVSMDEEMTNMMQYQRAFQANSRVITTINDLLENLVNLGKD